MPPTLEEAGQDPLEGLQSRRGGKRLEEAWTQPGGAGGTVQISLDLALWKGAPACPSQNQDST